MSSVASGPWQSHQARSYRHAVRCGPAVGERAGPGASAPTLCCSGGPGGDHLPIPTRRVCQWFMGVNSSEATPWPCEPSTRVPGLRAPSVPSLGPNMADALCTDSRTEGRTRVGGSRLDGAGLRRFTPVR
ncbi:hypothetical protein NDU88_002052 [Pleurodeles waltl]|uniref:Uncharacterized protein n=1 Tax=Pleurodeles waltl TaxID=8319 RepID=A0AAV7SEF8_PLEWA|nr:hypothetical protein NDU88_002052 [Pleurodeles waltl]